MHERDYRLIEYDGSKFGKRLSDIELSTTEDKVTAIFDDGTKVTGNMLIGADGASSRVRNYLLGPNKDALHALPLMGSMALGTLPAEISKKRRADIDGEMVLGYHPVGLVAFILRTHPAFSFLTIWQCKWWVMQLMTLQFMTYLMIAAQRRGHG